MRIQYRAILISGAVAMLVGITAPVPADAQEAPVLLAQSKLLKDIEKAAKKTGRAVEKGVKATGEAVGRAAQATGEAIETVAVNTGRFLERSFDWVCDRVDLDPDNDCASNLCYSRHDSDGDGYGDVYECANGDPARGDPTVRLPPRRPPTKDQLDSFEAWAEATRPSAVEMEPWADGSARLLPGRRETGTPLPDGTRIESPIKNGGVRTVKEFGVGYYLAPRAVTDAGGDRVGRQFQGGVDFLAAAGTTVHAPVSGRISAIAEAYAQDNHGLTAISIATESHSVTLFYVAPRDGLKIGSSVEAGEVIGTSQDLTPKFGADVANHVHLVVRDQNKRNVSPGFAWLWKPGEAEDKALSKAD